MAGGGTQPGEADCAPGHSNSTQESHHGCTEVYQPHPPPAPRSGLQTLGAIGLEDIEVELIDIAELVAAARDLLGPNSAAHIPACKVLLEKCLADIGTMRAAIVRMHEDGWEICL